MRQLRPVIAFAVAAVTQFVLLGLIYLGRPDKIDDIAVPIGIIVGGVASPFFGRSIVHVVALGATLGLLNAAGVAALDLPDDKLSVTFRWVVSVGFCTAVSAGTWLWTAYSARRPPGVGPPQSPT